MRTKTLQVSRPKSLLGGDSQKHYFFIPQSVSYVRKGQKSPYDDVQGTRMDTHQNCLERPFVSELEASLGHWKPLPMNLTFPEMSSDTSREWESLARSSCFHICLDRRRSEVDLSEMPWALGYLSLSNALTSLTSQGVKFHIMSDVAIADWSLVLFCLHNNLGPTS